MEWWKSLFIEHSVNQAIIIISLIIAIGLSLGKIRIFGISLGVTFVFFAGILAGHFGLTIDSQMLHYAENFGLIIFVYALGVQVGPGFFSSFRKGGIRLNMLALLVIFLGSLLTLVFHWTTGVSLPNMVGILCGAVTNTPALGAAQQTLEQLRVMDPAIEKTDLALGCAVAYPLGVIGVIIAIVLLRKLIKSGENVSPVPDKKQYKTYIVEFQAYNPGIFGKSIRDIVRLSHKKFIISRLWRNGKVFIPTSDTRLKEGDKLLVITSEADVEALTLLFGEQEHIDWNKEDIDWNAIDSQLISRRIVITRPEINGKKLGSLRLRNHYGINVTRVYRAGVELQPTSELLLQLGDRLTIVGEAPAIANVEKVLGNRVKSLEEPNLVAVFIGIVLGLLLGSVPIWFPHLGFPVKLGIAGGPIIIGILIGAFGPRIHMITYTTMSANLMLRGIGIAMYLACLGLDAGGQFFEIVFRPEGVLWIALGFALTLFPVLIAGGIALRFMHIDFGTVAGMVCGSMANPMALNYADSSIEGDQPSVSYATVYPLSMFVRVIIVQLTLMLFM